MILAWASPFKKDVKWQQVMSELKGYIREL